MSFLNASLLEGDSEEVEGVLWALVLLDMMLGKGQKHKAGKKKQKTKTKGRLQVSTKKILNKNLYDA